MRRRAFLTAAIGAGLAGCLSAPDGSPAVETAPSTTSRTRPTERRTAPGIEASFRIVDAHRPTEAGATAEFRGRQVVIEGTMDPAGCREPTLQAVAYDPQARTVRLVVGAVSPYGPTATVECGNASYDYRGTVTVADGRPAVVEVVHVHEGGADRTFVLERE